MKNDKLMPAAASMMQSIQNMRNEAEKITAEVVDGSIRSARGDAESFVGCYKDIIISMNKMLDIVTKPLNEANAVLNRMALHDFTMKMEESYTGN